MKKLILVCIVFMHICSGQTMSISKAPIIVKAVALTNCCSQDASFETQSIVSASFKVEQIYKGKIDSLPPSKEIYVGQVVPKGIEKQMNIVAGQKYIVLLEDSIIYNPVYKDISTSKDSNSDFFSGNYVFSHNQLVFNFYGFNNAALLFEEKIFNHKGRGNQIIKIDSTYRPNDILEVTFDALKIKDKLEIISENNESLKGESDTYSSGILTFVIIKDKKDLAFKITSKHKRSEWKLSYKLIRPRS